MTKKWKTTEMPDLSGRSAVVTGANGGLGLEISRELARAGARVTLACRDTAKGRSAADEIRETVPGAQLDVQALDLADLGSVRDAAARIAEQYPALDLLINNAGIMAPPAGTTADDFEIQLGTNHLGHFALTGLLMPALLAAPAARVVTVSSSFHKIGRVDVGKLADQRAGRWTGYARSKLANLLFAFELDRRARAAGVPLRSVAAHPGYAATNLQLAGLGFAPARVFMAGVNKMSAQSPQMGALPMLYAATVQEPAACTFVGPGSWTGHHGYPKEINAGGRAYDTEVATGLWDASERMTGVRYELAKMAFAAA